MGVLPQDGHLTFWYAAGIVVGSVLFIKGFGVYREFRIEEDTPSIPIRSIAMGFVHVHGEAQPGREGMLLSPVARTRCLFYKVDIDHWSGDAEQGNWRHWKTAWGGPFIYAGRFHRSGHRGCPWSEVYGWAEYAGCRRRKDELFVRLR